MRCGCVFLGSGFSCAPPFLAGVLGCVCVCVPAPLVSCYSWLGCPLWGCVLGLQYWLRPYNPGWGIGVCECSCGRFACTPPLLAGMCGVGVCAWAQVSAALRHFQLGCWNVCVFVWALRLYPATCSWGVLCRCVCLGSGFGCAPSLLAGVPVCVCGRALLVPRPFWSGPAVCGLVVTWHVFLCRRLWHVVRAAPVSGTRWPLLFGTCPCALVVSGGVPLWRAWWPCVGAPRLLRSGRSRCSARLSRRSVAFPNLGG